MLAPGGVFKVPEADWLTSVQRDFYDVGLSEHKGTDESGGWSETCEGCDAKKKTRPVSPKSRLLSSWL